MRIDPHAFTTATLLTLVGMSATAAVASGDECDPATDPGCPRLAFSIEVDIAAPSSGLRLPSSGRLAASVLPKVQGELGGGERGVRRDLRVVARGYVTRSGRRVRFAIDERRVTADGRERVDLRFSSAEVGRLRRAAARSGAGRFLLRVTAYVESGAEKGSTASEQRYVRLP